MCDRCNMKQQITKMVEAVPRPFGIFWVMPKVQEMGKITIHISMSGWLVPRKISFIR